VIKESSLMFQNIASKKQLTNNKNNADETSKENVDQRDC
jgi:hypothetical protein